MCPQISTESHKLPRRRLPWCSHGRELAEETAAAENGERTPTRARDTVHTAVQDSVSRQENVHNLGDPVLGLAQNPDEDQHSPRQALLPPTGGRGPRSTTRHQTADLVSPGLPCTRHTEGRLLTRGPISQNSQSGDFQAGRFLAPHRTSPQGYPTRPPTPSAELPSPPLGQRQALGRCGHDRLCHEAWIADL